MNVAAPFIAAALAAISLAGCGDRAKPPGSPPDSSRNGAAGETMPSEDGAGAEANDRTSVEGGASAGTENERPVDDSASAANAAGNSAGAGATPAGRTVSFHLRGPEDIIAVTHGKQVGIGAFPPGIPTLEGTELADTLLLIARLRDESGEIVGITSELEHFPDLPIEVGKPWDTYWTVVVPERGTLYGYHRERLSQEVYEVFASTRREGAEWRGRIEERQTVGPLPGNRGLVVGGTGEFEGASGWFVEIGELRGVTADGMLHATVELRFHLTD